MLFSLKISYLSKLSKSFTLIYVSNRFTQDYPKKGAFLVADGKESACNVGDPGLVPGSGKSPGEENGSQKNGISSTFFTPSSFIYLLYIIKSYIFVLHTLDILQRLLFNIALLFASSRSQRNEIFHERLCSAFFPIVESFYLRERMSSLHGTCIYIILCEYIFTMH